MLCLRFGFYTFIELVWIRCASGDLYSLDGRIIDRMYKFRDRDFFVDELSPLVTKKIVSMGFLTEVLREGG